MYFSWYAILKNRTKGCTVFVDVLFVPLSCFFVVIYRMRSNSHLRTLLCDSMMISEWKLSLDTISIDAQFSPTMRLKLNAMCYHNNSISTTHSKRASLKSILKIVFLSMPRAPAWFLLTRLFNHNYTCNYIFPYSFFKGSSSPWRAKNIFSSLHRPYWRTQPLIQWVPLTLSAGMKLRGSWG
jgi:hypothetical protein